MENKFTILPNNLFLNINGNDSLLLKCNNYKIILVLDYLYINTNRVNVSKFTIEDIITTYGFKARKGKDNINNQIKEILIFLQANNIIICDYNFNEVKSNELLACRYNGIDLDDNGNFINFTVIDYSNFNRIINYNNKNIDNVKLLFYYCYICCRMYKRKRNESVRNGGKAEICYPSFATITRDINISNTVINEYNNILIEENHIRIANFDYNSKENMSYRKSPNFYTLYTKKDIGIENFKNTLWYTNLYEGIKYYRLNNKNITNYNDIKILKGGR